MLSGGMQGCRGYGETNRGVTTSQARSGGRRNDRNTSGQQGNNLILHIETYHLELQKTIVFVKLKC